MGIVIMIAQVLLSLSILIVVHEFGHYIAARAFGIKVEKFYLFMDAWGIKLFKYKYKDCEYGIGWLPLGGYVKIAGMVDESMDKDAVSEQPKEHDFISKPVWQRMIVMLGGVILNVVLAIIIFWGMHYFIGTSHIDNSKLEHGIYPDSLAQSLGFKKGDKILAVNDEPVQYFNDIFTNSDVFLSTTNFKILRDGQEMNVTIEDGLISKIEDQKNIKSFIAPRIKLTGIKEIAPNSPLSATNIEAGDRILKINNEDVSYQQDFLEVVQRNKNKEIEITYMHNGDLLSDKTTLGHDGILGVLGFDYEGLPVINKTYGPVESLVTGIEKGKDMLVLNVKGFGKILSGDINPQKAIAGPIGIAKNFGRDFDWYRFWLMTAIISLALAFFNVVPIPGLDGGHLVLLGVEAIMGKPLPLKLQYKIQSVGMTILIILIILIFYNDIYNLF